MASVEISNPKISAVDTILNRIVLRVGIKGAILALKIEFPWLNNFVLSYILDKVVFKIATAFLGAISQYVSIEIIKFDNKEDEQAYTSAKLDLQKALLTGNKETMDAAEKKFNDDFDKLATFGHH